MSTLYETDSPDQVFVTGIKAITRVLVDDEVGDFAKGPLKALDDHREAVLELQKKQRESSLAAAYLNQAQIRTDRELGLYGQRMALSLSSHRKKGEKTPEYRYLFRGKTAATLLPSDDLQRREDLNALVRRSRKPDAAGIKAFAEFGALGEAIEAEKRALRECQRANEETEDAARVEENARIAVVVAIRAMNKDVQSYFADEPAMARRLLGHGNAVATRRRNARLAAQAAAEKAAEEAASAAKAAADAAIEAAVAKAVQPKAEPPCADAPLAMLPPPSQAPTSADATPVRNSNGAAGPLLDGVPPPASLPPSTASSS